MPSVIGAGYKPNIKVNAMRILAQQKTYEGIKNSAIAKLTDLVRHNNTLSRIFPSSFPHSLANTAFLLVVEKIKENNVAVSSNGRVTVNIKNFSELTDREIEYHLASEIWLLCNEFLKLNPTVKNKDIDSSIELANYIMRYNPIQTDIKDRSLETASTGHFREFYGRDNDAPLISSRNTRYNIIRGSFYKIYPENPTLIKTTTFAPDEEEARHDYVIKIGNESQIIGTKYTTTTRKKNYQYTTVGQGLFGTVRAAKDATLSSNEHGFIKKTETGVGILERLRRLIRPSLSRLTLDDIRAEAKLQTKFALRMRKFNSALAERIHINHWQKRKSVGLQQVGTAVPNSESCGGTFNTETFLQALELTAFGHKNGLYFVDNKPANYLVDTQTMKLHRVDLDLDFKLKTEPTYCQYGCYAEIFGDTSFHRAISHYLSVKNRDYSLSKDDFYRAQALVGLALLTIEESELGEIFVYKDWNRLRRKLKEILPQEIKCSGQTLNRNEFIEFVVAWKDVKTNIRPIAVQINIGPIETFMKSYRTLLDNSCFDSEQ